MHKKSQEKGFPHEKCSLENNYKTLESLLIKYQEDQQKVNADLSTVLERSRTLDRDMGALKPEIITLIKQRQQMAKWLRDHGKTREEINQLLEKFSLEEQQASLNSATHFYGGSSISPAANNNLGTSSSYGPTFQR